MAHCMLRAKQHYTEQLNLSDCLRCVASEPVSKAVVRREDWRSRTGEMKEEGDE